MIAGGAFLQNVLPLGQLESMLSGGTIPLINFGVGLEVAAGILPALPGVYQGNAGAERRGRKMIWVPFACAAWLCLIALYAMVTSRNLIHMIVCLAVMQSSTYLVILAVGYRTGATGANFP